MICGACGASVDGGGNFPGATVRCACGELVLVEVAAAAHPGPATNPTTAGPPNACPRCDRALAPRHTESLVVAACAQGHGLFMTHAVLREVKEAGSSDLFELDRPAPPIEDEPADPAFPCPRCGEAMDRRTVAGAAASVRVVVDVCRAHGTWFDAGELQAVLSSRAIPAPSVPGAEATAAQAKATLDVALALQEARDEETARRAVDTADDLLDTFNFLVLGRGRRRSPW